MKSFVERVFSSSLQLTMNTFHFNGGGKREQLSIIIGAQLKQ